MNTLRAIIVEDEPSGLENLRYKLQQNCPEVEIVAECTSGEEGIKAIKKNLPDLLFLDIMLGDMTGFDVLKAIRHPTFEVIFTTSYDDYAIQAIKTSALDYLLKPIEVDELQDAVAKARMKFIQKGGAPISVPGGSSESKTSKLGFPVATGTQFIDLQDIVYSKADDNVATLHLADGKTIVKLTKTLGWVEDQLTDKNFFRVHHSYLVNLNHIKEYIRQDGGYLIMSDKKLVSISRRRKDDFLQELEKWEKNI